LQEALIDTSLYVAAARRGHDGAQLLDQSASGDDLWLSAVVLEELYAGADERSRKWVEQLEAEYEREQRILVPNQEDWIETGRVLSRLALRYGYERIGRGRLTNDALIAVSAGRAGIRVMTANATDFRRLAEFRSFEWELVAG
jgi:predicted nucleic acid-binding protein